MTIYFIQIGDTGNVKSGFSERPGKRLMDLQVAHYEELHIRALIEGESEELAHRRFRQLRLRGEWFRNEEPLVSYVKSLPPISRAYRPAPWPHRHSIQTLQDFWCHPEITSDEEASERLEVPVSDLYRLFGQPCR